MRWGEDEEDLFVTRIQSYYRLTQGAWVAADALAHLRVDELVRIAACVMMTGASGPGFE